MTRVVIGVNCTNDMIMILKKLHLFFMIINVLIFSLLYTTSVKKKKLSFFSHVFVTWFSRAVQPRTHFAYTFDLFSFFLLSLFCSNGHTQFEVEKKSESMNISQHHFKMKQTFFFYA